MRKVKEKMCHVSLDYEEDMKNTAGLPMVDSGCQLPDGQFVHIGHQRFQAPEALFNPALMGQFSNAVC